MARKSKSKTGNRMYVLYTGSAPHWHSQFAFNEFSSNSAKLAANRWARYQGMTPDDVAIEEVTHLPPGVFLHNEYLK